MSDCLKARRPCLRSSRICRSRWRGRRRAVRRWTGLRNRLSPAARISRRRTALEGRQLSRACAANRRARNLAELIPVIVDQFARAESPDAAFASFDQFLAGLRPGSRLLPLLRQNPELIRFIALILGAAPRLAGYSGATSACHRSADRSELFRCTARCQTAGDRTGRVARQSRGYEEMLDAIRLFGQEHMFLIGARILSGSLSRNRPAKYSRAWPTCSSACCMPASKPILPLFTDAYAVKRLPSLRSAGSVRAK